MRIAFCHHLSLKYGGGGEKWLAELANELALRGHKVEVNCLPFTMGDAKSKVAAPVLLNEIAYNEGLFHNVKKADVTYVTYNPLNWFSFKTSRPRIAGIHSHCYWQHLDTKYGMLPNMANFFNSMIGGKELARFDAIHTVTDIYPISHNKVFFVPNFVDSKVYKPISEKRDEFTVGFASRKVWQKGYDIFKQLQHLLKGVAFVTTENLAEALMPNFYSMNHLTVVPARVDTFGLTLVESLMCKTPVLSSGLETHKSLNLPISCAESLKDYAERILHFKSIYKSVEYQKLVETGRTSAMQKYDKDKVINKLEAMLKEVAKCRTN